MPTRYDYLIAGAGAAGLSLAYYLSQQPALRHCQILLIDRERHTANNRTFSFWGNSPLPFDPVVAQRWSKAKFFGHRFSADLAMTYRTLRGEDFYRFVYAELEKHPNIHYIYGNATAIIPLPDGAAVEVDGSRYEANWVFNSLYQLNEIPHSPHHYYQWQHFKGWFITTPNPRFDPSTIHFMDFSTEQKGKPRFFYVLPFSDSRALVEYTAFSERVFPHTEYDQALREYIATQLGIGNYTITEEEFGMIPMTNYPFRPQLAPRVANIGTLAGCAKPSTGYTFMRIQEDCQSIANSLAIHGDLRARLRKAPRFRVYDTMILHLIATRGNTLKPLFTTLFQKNSIQRILDFLDERTSFWQEIRIFNTMPQLLCIVAVWESAIWHPVLRRLGWIKKIT